MRREGTQVERGDGSLKFIETVLYCVFHIWLLGVDTFPYSYANVG